MDTCSSVGTLVLRLLTLAEAGRFPHLGNKNGARVTAVFVLVPLAYFLGTFPSASIVARRAGKDVTREGSGNPGASNVTRMLGWKAGLVVLLLDMGKGALAAGVGLALDGHRGAYILGVAAVLGHVFPITRKFKGGRGVATAGGVLVVLFPLAIAILAVVWFAIARGLKKASIASVVCAVLFPVIVAVRGGSRLDLAVTIGLAAIVVVRHFANLRRLVRGEEPGLDRGPDDGEPRRDDVTDSEERSADGGTVGP
jgi:acyl phosphate:glycerol-3-phosphate acyltransferase